MPVLYQNKTYVDSIIADKVNCYLCGKGDNAGNSIKMNRKSFLKSGLQVLNTYEKIKFSVMNDMPEIGIISYENKDYTTYPVWIISYNFLKPNEMGKGHEGASVLFEFKKSKNRFELFQISTIP